MITLAVCYRTKTDRVRILLRGNLEFDPAILDDAPRSGIR